MKSDFRVYDNFRQSFRDYVQFLKTNPRYRAALNSPESDESFIRGIHKAGYATDPEYADKILSLLQAPAFQYANT
jgi:flagellar protein FlgJ